MQLLTYGDCKRKYGDCNLTMVIIIMEITTIVIVTVTIVIVTMVIVTMVIYIRAYSGDVIQRKTECSTEIS